MEINYTMMWGSVVIERRGKAAVRNAKRTATNSSTRLRLIIYVYIQTHTEIFTQRSTWRYYTGVDAHIEATHFLCHGTGVFLCPAVSQCHFLKAKQPSFLFTKVQLFTTVIWESFSDYRGRFSYCTVDFYAYEPQLRLLQIQLLFSSIKCL